MEVKKNKKLPSVVMLGRTNVGKSTLFNCLIERHQAIVSDIHGTTRDSNISKVEWNGKKFELVDTAGIMDTVHLTDKKKGEADDINVMVQKQAKNYLEQADLILFMVDNKAGLVSQDKEIGKVIKKMGRYKDKTILVANKVDNFKFKNESAEFNKLSFNDPIPISAANGGGTGDLLDIIVERLKKSKSFKNTKNEPEEDLEEIKVCILGKPNVGKSSLLNSILGYERVVVSDIAHTTREPQNTEMEYKKRILTFIDTAGISKQGKKAERLEKYGILKSLASLKKADIALLVLDMNEGITHQDARLIQEITDRHKSFVIIANKWDLVEDKDTEEYKKKIYAKLPFATWAPIQFLSAKTGSKVQKILDLVLEIDRARKIEIGDSVLNKFLLKIVKVHAPSKGKGTKRPRIYEFKQTKVNPPKFDIRIGSKDDLHFSYVRFIENRLREKFGFLATPIHMEVVHNKRVHGQHET